MPLTMIATLFAILIIPRSNILVIGNESPRLFNVIEPLSCHFFHCQAATPA
ncbi:hypothetical protein FHW67_003640 [Herbaspirillum sp. Sphag1AN]|nr:hypothetical protein [Herbaspirillum sp. Sphag1AN]MBB3247377.1 hypothetical protein [Herbaspirillum sp. Sphag64]